MLTLNTKINNNIINIISNYLITETIKLNKFKVVKHIDKYYENMIISDISYTFKNYFNINNENIENSHFWHHYECKGCWIKKFPIKKRFNPCYDF